MANSKSQIENRKSKILVVDDNLQNVELMEAYLFEAGGYEVQTAYDGEEALAKVAESPPDIVLLDAMMPRLDGFQVCRRLKGDEGTRLIPIVMITALTDLEDRLKGIEVGADDFLSKPVNKLELLTRVKSLVRVKHLNDKLENLEKVLITIAAIAEAKDAYTEGHLERMANYAAGLGAALGLGTTEQQILRYGGLLHDIGKIGVSEAILRKPGPLTPEEYAQMKEHTIIGERICQPLRFSAQVGPIVRGHHERWDGTGYPDGLKGEAVPLEARIVALADAFDAMTTDRPYRAALTRDESLRRLAEGAGSQFDPHLVQVALDVLKRPARLNDRRRPTADCRKDCGGQQSAVV
ncbi:MAG: HD domain-containing phosphohydrolase [Chloroflexota bacterium]